MCPVQVQMSPQNANVYRLMGNDENALSFALGHLMAVDAKLMLDVLKKMDVLPSVSGKSYKEYSHDYRVLLQERTEVGPSGRRDIEIEAGDANGLRVVVEAKIGKGAPDSCQLLRYSVGCGCGKHPRGSWKTIRQMWGTRQKKYIVALTRDAIDPSVHTHVSEKLSNTGIEFRAVQWASILEVALQRLKATMSDPRQALFLREFVDFVKEHYEMKTYQAEVMVKNDDLLNARDVYMAGHMYVGGTRDIELPLYFAPRFTKECVGRLPGVSEPGICCISKVIKVRRAQVRLLKGNPEAMADDQIRACELWSYWRKGLHAIAKRAEEEGWSEEGEAKLYFLSQPARLNRTVKSPVRIPPGYATTLLDLLTKNDLTRR